MGRRVTVSTSATLPVRRRGLAGLMARLTGAPQTYEAPMVGTALLDLPAGARVPIATLAIDVRGRPTVYIDSDDATVLRRDIRQVFS